MLNICIL